MNIRVRLLVLAVFVVAISHAQETVKLMHYNLLNYGNYNSYCTSSNNNVDTKDEHLRTIIDYTLPDIFTVNEIDLLPYYHERLLDEVMNSNGRTYYARAASTNYANSYTMNMLYYDTRKFVLLEETVAQTYLRDINVYKLFYKDPNLATHKDTAFLICLAAHLKAGSSNSDEQTRAEMTENMMDYLDNIGVADNYVFMGDFNVYTGSEQAIQNVLYHPNVNIRFCDPVNKIGDWNNNSSYAAYHTQSTHTSSNGCSAAGGMDDRFDFIMLSSRIMNGVDHYTYVQSSYQALGQDGNRLNGSIINPTNTSVPYNIANALYGMSDHLPVILELEIDPAPNGTKEAIASNQFSCTFSNPVKEQLSLRLSANIESQVAIELLNIFGEKIHTKELELSKGTNRCNFSTQNLKKGVYFLHIFNEESHSLFKVVKN